MGDVHFTHVHGKGSVVLEFSSGKSITLFNVLYVPKLLSDDSDSVYMSSSTVVNSSLWHARLGHVHYKRMLEISKDASIPAIDEILINVTTDDASRFCYVYLLHAKDEALDKFRIYKTEVELQQNDLIKTLRTDRGGEYYDPVFFQSVGIIHETTAPYTPQQNGVAERKNRALKEMVNSMFYVIEPNDSVSINSIIESRDAIFDENRFSSIPRPKDIIPNSDESQRDDHTDGVPSEDFLNTVKIVISFGCYYSMIEIERERDDQIDVKTTFLNGNLDDGSVLCKQPGGFVIAGRIRIRCVSGHVHWYGLKQAPKQWHQKFDEVVLSSGFLLNQSDKCVYSKFDSSGKGVIICLYVDDMLIFGTDQNQVDKTKKFLSSKFSMKDMGEADVILGIKIKRENKGIVITQSHYIEKILKKFNREDCSPVSTPMDPVEKLKPHTGKPVDQLEYSRAIGCLMYAMTSTRPDIAYAVGRLSRFTSNPSRQHWKAITRVFKYLRVFKQWKWTSNGVSCSKGSRIILGWNPDIVKVVVIAYDDQVMHTCVHFKDDKKDLFCSVIYAHNRYMQRRALWHNLVTHKAYVRDRPWCILGDFNVSLHVNDKSTGTSYIDRGMRDFQECVDSIEVLDVNSTGLRYTWNQKPKGGEGILKKIDRIMANSDFYDVFVGSSAYFQPYRISDHTPAVLRIPMIAAHKPRPFKFYNILAQNPRFKEIVSHGWMVNVSGFWMFKIVKRLKALKKPLRKLLYDQGNIHNNVVKLRHELDEAQKTLDSDPSNHELREEEAVYLNAFTDAVLVEEKFLSQKAKIEWLKLGDANTAYFHKVVKSQASRNRIDSITNSQGLCIDGDQVPLAFVDHYTAFLASHMIRDVTNQEIRNAMFSMGDNKAPGPDGYSAAFFKKLGILSGLM
ncbi:zinc finger, CCHC-type containing protein [Tanacetum coccineum]